MNPDDDTKPEEPVGRAMGRMPDELEDESDERGD